MGTEESRLAVGMGLTLGIGAAAFVGLYLLRVITAFADIASGF